MSKMIQLGLYFIKSLYKLPRLIFSAYIDPNTGGMLFQLLAVLFGVFSSLILLFSGKIKKTFYRLMRFFRGSRQDQPGESDIQVEN